MKLAIFLTLGLALNALAEANAQKITLNVKNTTLGEVMREFQKQQGYSFLFHGNHIADIRVDARLKQVEFADAMDIILTDRGLGWSLDDGIVTITERPSLPRTNRSLHEQRHINGTVSDEHGQPLEGVTITVKGTSIAVTTDAQGKFEMALPRTPAVAVFTIVGFETIERTITNQSTIDIVMKAVISDLEEVVVVAYGTQKKATLTGAVASINTKEIKQSPAANLAVTLAGRLPGLFAQQTSGEPGRDVTQLFMRGRGTVNGSAPLILVDGVERSLTSIDPNEVETVSILKDASSTALFGVRGANGVILVTTKRGTHVSPVIGLTAEAGIQTFTRWPTQLDSYDWALLRNQAWHNDFPNPGPNDSPPYSPYALERFKLQDFPEVYPNNNWINRLMNKQVPQTRYNLTLNGKGQNVGYFVNVGFLNQSGQWKIDPSVTEYDPSQYMRRYNFRSNIDAYLNKSKTLKTFLNAAGYLERVNGPYVEHRFNNATATAEIVSRLLTSWPTVQPGPTTPDGEILIGQGSWNESPWAYINRTGYRQESRNSMTASWGLEQDLQFLTEGLSTKLMLSFDTRTVHHLNGSKQFQYWVQVVDPNTQTADGRDSVYYQRTRTDFDNTPLSIGISDNFQSFYEMQWHVNYNRSFNNQHTVTGLVLAQQQALIKPSDPLPFNVRGLATRLTYAYKGRYVAEFNAGFNGSEQFAKGRRYGFFPSGSFAWNIQHEPFFKDISESIELFRIRGSYGTVGGDQLGGRRFLYLDDIQRGEGSYSGTLGRGARINESFFGNRDIRWEVAKKANVGIELGLFNQLTIIADFFKERRDNVLIYRGTIPDMIGVPSNSLAPFNIGVIDNQGYELELNYRKVVSTDFSVLGKVNFNYASNQIVFNDEVKLPEDFAYRYRTTGYQIGQQWGYRALGFFNSQEEIDEYGVTYQGVAPRPGDLKFEDINGDGLLDDRDEMPIGESSLPKYSWGGALNVSFRGFDFSVLFQGAFGVSGQYNPWETNDFRERHMHAWTPERAASGYDIRYPALSLRSSSNQNSNTFFNENKSFVRLKNIELGYTIPSPFLARLSIKRLRVYANGLNLFTWDSMSQKDWDPELNSISSFPVYRLLNFGINASF